MNSDNKVHHPILDRMPKAALDTLGQLGYTRCIERHASGDEYLVKMQFRTLVVPEEVFRFLETEGLVASVGTKRRVTRWSRTERGEQVHWLRYWKECEADLANPYFRIPDWSVLIAKEYVERVVRELEELLRTDEDATTPNVATPDQCKAEAGQGGHDEE